MVNLKKLAGEDEKEISKLYELFKKDSFRYLRSKGVLDTSSIEDIYHRSILGLIRAIQRGVSFADLKHYFLGILKKQHAMMLRSRRIFEDIEYHDLPVENGRLNYLELVEHLINKVGEKCQKLLRISIYAGLDSGELLDLLSRELNLTRASAKVTKTRCEAKIRELVDQQLGLF